MSWILHRIWLARILALGLTGCGTGCPGAVSPPASLQAAGEIAELELQLQAVPAALGDLSVESVRTGFLEAQSATRIAAEVAGTVSLRRVSDGQRVKAGEVLFRLEDGRQRIAHDGAAAAVDAAKVELSFLEDELERAKRLVARKAAPTRQLDAATLNVDRAQAQLAQAEVAQRKANRALADTTLRAPHDGIVHGRQVDVGDQVAPGRPLMELVDLTRVRLRVGVGGASASRLKVGAVAPILVDDLGGQALSASLITIAPRSDPRTGLFEVVYEATPAAELGVRAGMVARVAIAEASANALLIPRAALVLEKGRPAVFIVEDGRAQKRLLRLGQSNASQIVVEDGLAPGDLVVVSGLHALASGVRLKVEQLPSSARSAADSTADSPAELSPRKSTAELAAGKSTP